MHFPQPLSLTTEKMYIISNNKKMMAPNWGSAESIETTKFLTFFILITSLRVRRARRTVSPSYTHETMIMMRSKTSQGSRNNATSRYMNCSKISTVKMMRNAWSTLKNACSLSGLSVTKSKVPIPNRIAFATIKVVINDWKSLFVTTDPYLLRKTFMQFVMVSLSSPGLLASSRWCSRPSDTVEWWALLDCLNCMTQRTSTSSYSKMLT